MGEGGVSKPVWVCCQQCRAFVLSVATPSQIKNGCTSQCLPVVASHTRGLRCCGGHSTSPMSPCVDALSWQCKLTTSDCRNSAFSSSLHTKGNSKGKHQPRNSREHKNERQAGLSQQSKQTTKQSKQHITTALS